MDIIDPKPKRKNDDKGAPRRARLTIVMVFCAIVGGMIAYSLNRSRSNSEMPFAPLVYVTTTGERYALNFQTGERTLSTSWGNSSAPDSDLLPNGKWRLGAWSISDPQSYDPEVALTLKSAENPGTYIDTGRIAYPGSASWSSDSQWIVFPSRAPNCFPESKAGLKTTLPATPRPRIEYCVPGLSNNITYGASELWFFNILTGETFPITAYAPLGSYAVFSPRQSQIVYTNQNHVYVFDVETREAQVLFSDRVPYSPIWSPDAQWIAFTAGPKEGARELYIVRVDGTGLMRVATDVTPYRRVHWIP